MGFGVRPVAGKLPVGQAALHHQQTWVTAMKRRHFGTAAAASAMLIAATSLGAEGNRNCAPRDKVVERLATGYGETVQSMGLGANNSVVEVFASQQTGTWTITVTLPNGMTCLVASGQAFEELAEVAIIPGSDA
jgi:hypothetical protein